MRSLTQTKPTPKSSFTPVQTGILQRKCACGNSASLTGKCTECENKRLTLQRRSNNQAESNQVPPIVHEVLREPGQPLDTNTRTFMESRFGHDFSQVRVHTDAKAAASAQAVNALAYTVGHNVVFGTGQYALEKTAGRRLLAHELTHVVQQKGVVQSKLTIGQPNDKFEQEADRVAERVVDNAASFHTTIATADGTVLDDEPFKVPIKPTLTTESVASQPVRLGISTNNVPVIQRATRFVAGTVSATTNLAAHLIAGNRDAGFTPPTLNGTQTLSIADTQGAIRPPILGGRSNVDGTVSTWVETVPTNEASFTMQLPSSGPWSTTTAKANVAALFTSLGLTAQAGCATAGNTTFTVNGKPSDADFAANTRTHENLHATDHETGFNTIIVPWDARLEAAKTLRTRFSGPSVAAAESALFTAMGGTPDQIAAAQFNEWIRLNNITHRGTTLATGGTATPSNSAANASCTTSSMDVT